MKSKDQNKTKKPKRWKKLKLHRREILQRNKKSYNTFRRVTEDSSSGNKKSKPYFTYFTHSFIYLGGKGQKGGVHQD